MSPLSYVVTGGGRGVGRAVVERLAADGGTVVVVERDTGALDWLARHPLADRLHAVTGTPATRRSPAGPPTAPRRPRRWPAGSTTPPSSATPTCTARPRPRSST
ncbi:SDR family NAD(P)-dependent oxidoreductase [Micromonospora aurantiaca]|uniref:SDR family NAD(P)-dependent oxidoreductase n=1 Tax=Micromonospora aurantiaca (nom. illeg.) TaxID=47850 RepID=UPI0033D3595D